MEENFYKDEFEVFLKEQADNHRMFPSDSVWRNIFTKLHSDEKWPALTVTAFAFLATIIAVSLYFSPGPNVFAYKTAPIEKASSNKSFTLAENNKQSNNSWNYVDNDSRESSSESQLPNPAAGSKEIQNTQAVKKKNNIEVIQTPVNTASDNSTLNLSQDFSLVKKAENPVAGAVEISNVIPTNNTTAAAKTLSEKVIEKDNVDQYLKQHSDDVKDIVSNKNKLTNKWSYKVYITPSASFRRLKEDPSDNVNSNLSGPLAINYVADVNKIVRHTPGTGIEAGVAFAYNLTNNFKITSGFQFNIRQYLIEAYSTYPEIATIALRTGYGYDSVTRTSDYRTTNGNAPAEIMNRYYQVSVPVGVQWQIIGSKNVALNIAGSVQPTYTLNKNGYLISTNFKNYAESGAMLRNWNVNTNIEAFLSIKSGNYRWQIGPQFRYQQLPTFTRQYPIREHLMDYGLKIGVSKSIQ